MAHVTLEGNKIVVKCDDGTPIRPGITVDKAHLDNLSTLVSNAIDKATLQADDKHVDEVSKLANDVPKETAIIRGQLTSVPKTLAAAPKETKTITAPVAAPPKETKTIKAPVTAPPAESVIPTLKDLETNLIEAGSGDLKPVAVIYEGRAELDKKLGAQFPGHLAAATRIVFTELSKIPTFLFRLNGMTDNREFSTLREYLKTNKSLVGAGPEVIDAANIYIRYFVLDLHPLNDKMSNHDYVDELAQLPKSTAAMKNFHMPDLKPLSGHMGSETAVAAALYIRRWNLERQGMNPAQIPKWQSQVTTPASVKEQPAAAPQISKTPLDTARFEMRW
jgi:hypothetical protein